MVKIGQQDSTNDSASGQDTDAALVDRAQEGDTAAFHTLVDRHAPSLYRLAYTLVGNAVDAEDVLQETFAGAFRALVHFEKRAAVRTWLGQILVRQAAELRRRRAVRRTVSTSDAAVAAPLAVPGHAEEVDTREDLMGALEQLSLEHRTVIIMRELEGLPYEEIAATLAVPRGTVESRLHRARQELRSLLKGYKNDA